MKEGRADYCPVGFTDTFENGELIPGAWREQICQESMFNTSVNQQHGGRPTQNSNLIREHFMDFFNSNDGKLEWQSKAIFK